MDTVTPERLAYTEIDIQTAISAIKNKEFASIRKAAVAFNVPYPTLRGQQLLSPAEENTLSRWVTRLTRTGFPASPALVIEMAEEIRRGRVWLSKDKPEILRPISESWLNRFKARNPDISGIWTRQIDTAQYRATSYDGVKRWFDAVTELWIHNQYDLDHVYNIDESGFAVRASQSSRALVNIRETSSWKQIGSRQEWITAIECRSASGVAVPPSPAINQPFF
ncbi:hypothetical protein Q7P35_010469 [Cladosporium inversicolor]